MKKNRFSKIINFRVVGLSILIAFILLTYSKTAVSDTVDITLAQGWNFISLPILPNNNNTQDVLSGLTGTKWLYWYDVSIEDPMARWKIYDSNAPSEVNTLTSMEPNRAYWLWVASEQTLSVAGYKPAVNSVTLYPGWNMVSFQDLSGTVENVLANMTLTDVRVMYAFYPFEDPMARWKIWDDVPETPNTFTNIEPTKGYYLWSEIGLPTIPTTPADGIWVNPVPEPSTMLFLVSTLLGLTGLGWKFKK